MGLELAEARLLAALRREAQDVTILPTRVVGGRAALRHARRVSAQWVPAPPGRVWGAGWRGSDLVHLVGLDVPPPRRARYVATVYDLSPLVYGDEGTLPPWFDELAAGAEALLTPTAFTASELTRLRGIDPDRMTVFSCGPALELAAVQPLTPVELERLGIRPPFVLRAGGYTQRKNVPLLLEAWQGVSEGTLVLAGPAQPARARILAETPAERVVVYDYLPAGLLARLMCTAAVVASPSLYEGFGLPVLEALSAGAPVVAVRTPFAEEICADAALLVDPDPTALREAIVEVMQDHELANRLGTAGVARSAEFTWGRAASRVLSAYDVALGYSRSRR